MKNPDRKPDEVLVFSDQSAIHQDRVDRIVGWWRRQRGITKVFLVVFVLGLLGNVTEGIRSAFSPPSTQPKVASPVTKPAPREISAPTPAPSDAASQPSPVGSNVADLPAYLAGRDKTVAWLIDTASVNGNELIIIVNRGWQTLTTEQKVALASTLLPAAFILSREADGIKDHDRVIVSIYDTDRQPIAVYYSDTGRYRVYR